MVRVKNPQDFGAAAVFVVVGAAGLYFASDLAFGTASRMGPGYFPTLLSAIILLIGLVLGVKALSIEGPPVERIPLRPILVIVVCIAGFGALIERLGVAIAAAALVLVASYARPGARPVESIALAVGLSVFVIAVFVYALAQPLPVWWSR